MKILQSICLSSVLLNSPIIFAAQATDQQVEKIIELEHWTHLKEAVIQNGLPNLKNLIEDSFIQNTGIPQPISAHEQIIIMQISDIIVNDTISQIDEKKLLTNVRRAYKNLTQEQAKAVINLYQSNDMRNAGEKAPQIIAYGTNLGLNTLSDILNSPEVKKAVQLSKLP